MYDEFSTSNIQIEKDFTAKLSGYGCVGFNSEEERSSASMVSSSLNTIHCIILFPLVRISRSLHGLWPAFFYLQ
jgi:hypothetical protein